jgi:hypothetical protein
MVVILTVDAVAHTLSQVRSVNIDPEGGGVERLEVTHAEDEAKQYVDGLPDTPRDVMTIQALDESGTSSYYKTLAGAAYTAGTLDFYPEGNSVDKPEISATGYALKPKFAHAYADVNTVELTFQVDETSGHTFTYGTVS